MRSLILSTAVALALVGPAAAAPPRLPIPSASQVLAAASVEFRDVPGADLATAMSSVGFEPEPAPSVVPWAALPAPTNGKLWSALRSYLTAPNRGPHLAPADAARHLRRIWAAAPGVTL